MRSELAACGLGSRHIQSSCFSPISSILLDELFNGMGKADSERRSFDEIDNLKICGAFGFMLGCTETGILVSQGFVNVPAFDTTSIHARKSVYIALAK